MLIHDAPTDPLATKEMKIVLPARLHLKLHSLKILTGKTISDAIREALDAYFEDRPSR